MIIAVRHPRPQIATGICYGRLDVGLAEPATAGVERLLPRLREDDTARAATRVVTSPLRRAAELAGPLAEALGLPLVEDARLQELDFGTWEGMAWSRIARGDLDAWASDVLQFRPGGGETAAELYQRVATAWHDVHMTQARQIWITHAGPIRCLLALSRNAPIETHLSDPIGFEEAFRLDWSHADVSSVAP